MIEQNLLLILVLLPFAGAIAAATLPVYAHNAAAWLSGLIMCAGLAIMAALWGTVSEGNVVRSWVGWVPSAGLNLSLRVDGFAWMFVTLVLSIGVLVVIYARYYLAKTDPVPRFYSFLMAFTGAMLGILISGNMMMLVVFWELTSVFSFLLIGYWHGNPSARDGARTSLIITAGGGVCLLAATLIIGQIVGSYEIDRILVAGDQIRSSPLYIPLIILFLLGAFTKSAQFPFHFWLPGAMTAPTPVSAFLHSATMVKAGVFLLIRFSPAIGGTDIWFYIVTATGLITLVMGGAIALFRHDLKGLLAYSTISHLGLITALVGMGTSGAMLAAIFHIVNHAVFKASLFMSAGIIDHETGTRDMRKLSGLIHAMPITATLAIIAASAMAGVPLLNGFISKEMFFAEAAEWHNGTLLDLSMPWIATLAGALSVAYSARFVVSVFMGPLATDLPRPAHEPKAWMRRPVEILVLICLIVGVFPAQTLGTLLNVALQSVVGPRVAYMDVAVWHGFNLPLQMSIAALVCGGLLYALTGKSIAEGPEGPPWLHRIRAQRIYEWILLRLTWKWPRRIYRMVGTEKLQSQLRILVLLSLGSGILVLWGKPWFAPASSIGNNLDPAFALLWLAGCACAVSAAWQAKYHRFASLILLSGAGMVTCLTFVWFSAPDLAVTQLLVEIVTTVLMLLGLRWLPKRRSEIAVDELRPAKFRRMRDLVIASLSGAGIAAVAYAVMTRPLVPNIGDWFLRNAYYEAGGTNAVNVILVDFRAFDTFGEITVLAIVALTVFALLRRFRPAPESIEAPHAQSSDAPSLMEGMLVPSVIMRWMFPVLILISADLFFRGHDLPGGGFAAGITMAIAFLLQYLGSNAKWIEARLNVLPTRWMGLGLLISGITGMGAWLFGYPFLTAHARYLDIPLIGKVPAATALLFDAGVFSLVMGAVVLMLIAIAHQSLRAIRMRDADVAEKAEKKETT